MTYQFWWCDNSVATPVMHAMPIVRLTISIDIDTYDYSVF